MTAEEKQEIVSEVISAIRTNSAQITDLTEVQELPSGGYIELSGGRRISASVFLTLIQAAIVEGSITPLITRVGTLENGVSELNTNKFDKANVVEASGNSSELVMSQKYVTMLLNSLGIRLANINVAKGTNGTTNFEIRFTNDQGSTTTITLTAATTSKAGLLSAADKTSLEDLKGAKVTNMRVDTGEESVSVVVENVTLGDAFAAVIPKAGTIPEGETDPVAGVMSAEQAQDLDAVVLQVFPLEVTVASSNAGLFEKGTSVTPNVKINIMRRGEGVARNASLVSTMRVAQEADNYLQLTYDAITENTSFNIAVSHKGSTVNVPQQQYRFVNFIYGDVLSAAPEPGSIATHLREARTLSQLSTSTTYNGTLQAGKFFIFGVPGNVTLMCRHSETGAIISGCTTGTVQVPRQNNYDVTDLYSYIVVPSSDVAWNFKITNS